MPKTEVKTAPRRTAQKSPHAERFLALVEKVENPVGQQRQPIAHVPAEVVIGQPRHLAEVVAVGIGKQADVGVQHDPIDNVLVARRAAFRLPSLPGAEAKDRQVVDHFHARRGNRTAQSRAHGIKTLVQLHGKGVRRTVVGIYAEPLPFGHDRIVIQ